MLDFTPLAEKFAAAFSGPLGSVVLRQYDRTFEFDFPMDKITVHHETRNVSVFGYDDLGRLTLEPLTDGFYGDFHGNVGDVNVFDVWNANLTVRGDVGELILQDVNHFDLSIWGQTNVAILDNFQNSTAYFGSLQEGTAEVTVNSTVTIGTLEEEFQLVGAFDFDLVVYNGWESWIDIVDSSGVNVHGYSMDGARIDVWDSRDTAIVVEYGDVNYHDHGSNTTIRDGWGNSTFVLHGNGTALVNGGGGDDFFEIGHRGDLVIAGGSGADTFVFRDPGQANVTILDFDEVEGDTGWVSFGNGSEIDLGQFMAVFGNDNGDGSATATIGEGSITTYASDDFMFA